MIGAYRMRVEEAKGLTKSLLSRKEVCSESKTRT